MTIHKLIKLSTAFFLLAIIAIFSEKSVDYIGYLTYFRCAQSSYCTEFMNGVEVSFIYGARVFGTFFGDKSAGFFLFSIAAISLLIKVRVIDNFGVFWIPVFCYLTFQFFQHEMTQIRIGIGIAFFWIVIFKKYKTDKFSIIFSMLSVLMHYSMLVGIFVFWFLSLPKNKMPKRAKLLVTIILYIAAFLISHLSDIFVNFLSYFSSFERLSVYISALDSDYYSVPQFSIQLLAFLIISLSVFYFPRDKFSDTLHNMIIAGVSIYLAFYWIPVIPLRVFEILTSVLPIYFACVLKKKSNWSVQALIFSICLVVSLNFHIRNNSFSEDNLKVQSELDGLI